LSIYFTTFRIVYVGGARASQVGHDPVYGRHTGMREKERTVGGAVLSLFFVP